MLRSSRQFWIGFAILALAHVFVFLPVLSLGLLSDDWGLSYVDSPPLYAFRGHWFGGGGPGFYRPIPRLALYWQARAFGFGGTAQHAIGMALVLATALLIAWTARRRFGPLGGLAAAALLLFNPNITETEAWIASQTDLLEGLFHAASLAALAPPFRSGKLALSLLCAVGAYMSKESAFALGPSAILLCLGLRAIRPKPARPEYLWPTAIVHGALWLGYLAFRKLIFGAVAPPQGAEPLARPWIDHLCLNFLSVCHETLAPFFLLAPARDFASARGAAPYWAPLLAGAALVWLIRSNRRVLALFAALWLASVAPALLQTGPWLYSSMEGQRRMLYLGLLVFALAGGWLAQWLWSGAGPRARTALALGSLALLFRLSFACSARLDDWTRCAAVRDRLEGELIRASSSARGALFVVESLPERIGEGYVFLNGFHEFFRLRVRAAGARHIAADALAPSDLASGQPVYRLRYSAENADMAARAPEYESLPAELPSRRSQAVPPRYWFDTTPEGAPAFMRLEKGEDVIAMEYGPGGLELLVRPRDPYLRLPFEDSVDPAVFRKAAVELEWLDPGPLEGVEETIELIWKPRTENAPLYLASARAVIRPGAQLIEFDLGERADWLVCRRLEWARFDLGYFYEGRLRVARVGFLP